MRLTERNGSNTMLERVDAIFSAFQGPDRVLGVSELARRTGIPKASISRIVAELVRLNLLEKSDPGIKLGIRLFELGEHASGPKDLRRLAFPHMLDLRTSTNQTVHLAVLDGKEVVYVQILRSRATPPLPSRVGGRLPAYATGVGKALLAHVSPNLLSEHLPATLEKIGPKTITDRTQLFADLAQIRTSGLAYEIEESASDVGCAAAAILSPDRKPVAAISVSVHLGTAHLSTLGPAVATAARAASRESVRLLK